MPFLDAGQDFTESIYPTEFDTLRLKEMNSGDKVDGENGNFSVLKYPNEYVLLLYNSKKYNSYQEFSDIGKLITFLKRA